MKQWLSQRIHKGQGESGGDFSILNRMSFIVLISALTIFFTSPAFALEDTKCSVTETDIDGDCFDFTPEKAEVEGPVVVEEMAEEDEEYESIAGDEPQEVAELVTDAAADVEIQDQAELEEEIEAPNEDEDKDNCPSQYNPDQLDSDGDGQGDLCDLCPADEDNGCGLAVPVARNINETGNEDDPLSVSVTKGEVSGFISLVIPERALYEDTSISIQDSENSSGSYLDTDEGAVEILFEFIVQKSQLVMSPPAIITFQWIDEDGDDLADIENIKEDELLIVRDGEILTPKCRDNDISSPPNPSHDEDALGCDKRMNTYVFETDEFGAIALGRIYPSVCGNGEKEPGEDCDDGNTENGDGCDSRCKDELCGNEIIDKEKGERCDGRELGGVTCSDLDENFMGGTLSCNSTCDGFDKSLCMSDKDRDRVPDEKDNCPDYYNPEQLDNDGDHQGDDCDSDDDNDSVLDYSDNCPLIANADQADMDRDNQGDLCDDDLDGDGIMNEMDNCPLVSNQMQSNGDGDSLGDVCDVCPDTAPAAEVNLEGCSIRQMKTIAAEEFQALEDTLVKPGSAITEKQFSKTLNKLNKVTESIVDENYLYLKKPPKDETAVEGADVPRPLTGNQVFKKQQSVYKKLEKFKSKEIDGTPIKNNPEILESIEKTQADLVGDSQFLAKTLLDDIGCGTLEAGTKASKKCLGGEELLASSTAEDPYLTGVDRIALSQKAWRKAVRTLKELGVTGNVAKTVQEEATA